MACRWTGCGGMRHVVATAACVGLAVTLGGVARAGQPTIESLPLAAAYGDGVHAYFGGDYERAYQDLTQAIEAGTNDPRAFYFRGLAALRQGRSDEAEADFTTGADRESLGLATKSVSRSLERIQGPDRMRLERHRTRARVALLQRQREAEQRRYSQILEAQPDVLRRRRPAAPRVEDEGNVFEEPAAPAAGGPEPAPPAEPEAAPAEPMPEPAGPMPEAAEPAEPAEPATPAGDDPFGDGATNSSKAEQAEDLAAEREDVAAQRDEQAEAGAAEAESDAAQSDQQAEQEAAAGDR